MLQHTNAKVCRVHRCEMHCSYLYTQLSTIILSLCMLIRRTYKMLFITTPDYMHCVYGSDSSKRFPLFFISFLLSFVILCAAFYFFNVSSLVLLWNTEKRIFKCLCADLIPFLVGFFIFICTLKYTSIHCMHTQLIHTNVHVNVSEVDCCVKYRK